MTSGATSKIDKIDFVVLRARNYGGYSEYRLFMEKMLAEIGFKSVISESEFEKTIEAKGKSATEKSKAKQ